jgi:hypothetical protein
MSVFTEVWSTVKPLWEPAKALYKNISGLASLLALPTLSKYFYDKWKKKRQMPELACNIVQKDYSLDVEPEYISDEQGNVLTLYGENKRYEQKCMFTISNISEHTALKLKVANADSFIWDFPIISTRVLKSYESTDLSIYPYIITTLEEFSDINKKRIIIDEIIIEYRNTSGRKYQLTFKPNEKDIDKRNVCRKI